MPTELQYSPKGIVLGERTTEKPTSILGFTLCLSRFRLIRYGLLDGLRCVQIDKQISMEGPSCASNSIIRKRQVGRRIGKNRDRSDTFLPPFMMTEITVLGTFA